MMELLPESKGTRTGAKLELLSGRKAKLRRNSRPDKDDVIYLMNGHMALVWYGVCLKTLPFIRLQNKLLLLYLLQIAAALDNEIGSGVEDGTM